MKRWIAPLLAGLVFALSGCGIAAGAEGTDVQFYYSALSTETSGPAIQSETDRLDAVTVPNVLSRLFRGPDSALLAKTFPDGTVVQNWVLQEGTLTLDLSESFSRLSGIALTRAEYCIVLTLAQLPDIETVTITVDGQSLPGAVSGPLSVDDVILKGETEDPFTIGVQLYFPLTDGSGLGVEYREFDVAALTLKEQANAVLRELALGPKTEDMASFLGGMGVLEATEIRGEVCVVSLDSATLECICRPEENFQFNLFSIVDSLTELEGISSVSFLLDGAPIDGWKTLYDAVYEF